MEDNYNYRMSDLEYKKHQLRKNIQTINNKHLFKPSEQLGRKEPGFRDNMSELDESDYELHGADVEDNWSDSAASSGDESRSLGPERNGD